MADLYDQPLEYFKYGCVTDGKFDAEKARALGYSDAQIPVIEEALYASGALEASSKTTQPLPEQTEE